MKYLKIEFSDGSLWQAPAQVVAENRAEHYVTSYPDRTTREAEIAEALADEDELVDWAKNNMNWSDVKDKALMVSPATPPDYEKEWCNAEMDVVEAE